MRKSKTKLKRYDLVCIEWLDIVTFMGWEPSDLAFEHPPHTCSSIGYVVNINNEYISLAATIGRNGGLEHNQGITIPLGCILNVKKVQV